MIRVLIVDDSPTLRKLTRAILESDPALQVVGEARNSEEAVALTHKLQPDIITMDVRMSEMDGYQAIRRIMAESPRPIVVLTSTESDREPPINFKALEAGALMVVGKPHGLPDTDPQADQLIAQVKTMAEIKVVRRRWWLLGEKPASPRGEPVEPGQNGPVVTTPRAVTGPVRLIAIGASTGGPPALQIIFGQLPPGLPVPIVVVQHISHGFVGGLARWLGDTTPLRIKVAETGEPLRSGTVYLAPDDQHGFAQDLAAGGRPPPFGDGAFRIGGPALRFDGGGGAAHRHGQRRRTGPQGAARCWRPYHRPGQSYLCRLRHAPTGNRSGSGPRGTAPGADWPAIGGAGETWKRMIADCGMKSDIRNGIIGDGMRGSYEEHTIRNQSVGC
jgi:chemotaxis response regulator CheB